MSASAPVVEADRLVIPWYCERHVIKEKRRYGRALIRVRLFLLRLKMQIVSFSSTLPRPGRMYELTHAVSHKLILFNFAGNITVTRLLSVGVPLKSVLRTIPLLHE